MNHKERTKKLESSVFLLNFSFIAFETFNSANFSASLALGSVSVLNGSLYHKTCNVSLLKYDQNSVETVSRCPMMQVLMLPGKSIVFIFKHLSNKGNEVVDPTLIRACRTPIGAVSPASLPLTSLAVTLTALQRIVHVVEVAE